MFYIQISDILFTSITQCCNVLEKYYKNMFPTETWTTDKTWRHSCSNSPQALIGIVVCNSYSPTRCRVLMKAFKKQTCLFQVFPSLW